MAFEGLPGIARNSSQLSITSLDAVEASRDQLHHVDDQVGSAILRTVKRAPHRTTTAARDLLELTHEAA